MMLISERETRRGKFLLRTATHGRKRLRSDGSKVEWVRHNASATQRRSLLFQRKMRLVDE
jgi:hypothetical protein